MIRIAALFSILSTFQLYAQNSRPLYELGFIGAMASVPAYPASEDTNNFMLYFPSFIYRGLIFRNDDKGTRASFFRSEKIDIDLSFGASFPAAANETDARAGMEDLDWLGEAGPRFSYMLTKNNEYEIELEFPLRFVFSTDFEFTKQRGYRFQPQIDLRFNLSKHFLLNLSYKLNYGSEDLNDYFYEVTPKDVTTTREEFNARPGFIGQDFGTNIIYRYRRFIAIIGMRRSTYHDTANQDSPLFRARENYSQFIGFNYFFFQSKEQASKNSYSRTPTQ